MSIILQDAKIVSLRVSVREDMLEYMHEEDVGYSEQDIAESDAAVQGYLEAVARATTSEEAMGAVRTVVLTLNALNAKCGHELIETDAREDLAEIIIRAAHLKGFCQPDEDITEQWREW